MVRLLHLFFSNLVIGLIVFVSSHSVQAQPTPTPIQLPSGYDWKYNPENGHYYALVNTPQSWNEAKLFSESVGGYLFTITNEIEEQWIIITFSSISDVWMGLGGTPRGWVSGEPLDYTNWYISDQRYLQPSTQYAPCFFYIRSPYSGKWYDETRDLKYPFIIEIQNDPLPTPTPIITPTPTPTPELWSSLNGNTLEENHLWVDAPSGFTKGKVQVGEIPSGQGSDNKGLEIKLAPGQGAWILSDKVFEMGSLAHITGSFRLSNKSGAVALVALNSPIDGQFGYTNIMSEEIPVDDYRQFQLIYEPPSGKMQIAIQAVNYAYSSISTTVWIDNLNVVPFTPVVNGEAVKLQVNGNFEGGLENLFTNVNDQDGTIIPFFESLTDIALRLSIKPDQTAANIGTICEGIYDKFPMRLLGQVSVQRDSLPGGGMLGFVLTNGFQNLGVFRFADQIPDINAPKSEPLIIGGDFTINNPDIPISTFVQIGGPNADVSVVVDDLMILKQ